MRGYSITINDIPYTEQCKALTWTDHTNAIGRFDAALQGTHDIDGFQTVKIFDDDIQVFQGRVGSPVKENVLGGSGMPIGGLEWTGNLKDYITDYDNKTQQTLTEFLRDALVNSIYGIGDIDELEQTEIEMQVWEAALDFLPFTFSDTCIVYTTDVEVEDSRAIADYELPDSNRRCSFYDKSNGFFYIIAYEQVVDLLKYDSTADFDTWKGFTTLGFDKGAVGTFGITWDESLGILYLIVDDGTNIDTYEYTTDATGTLTQTDFDDDVATNSTLIAGPVLDSEGDVWFICEDTTTTRYELWQFDISANTWTKETDWLVSGNDIPKYMFMGDVVGDVIVIMFNDDTDAIEEWLWDESGSTLAKVRDISPLSNDDCGYICGFQDTAKNMFIIWEDEYAAGDADLNFSRKTIDVTMWEASVKVVDDDDYQSMNQFQLSGDEADNLYLFYVKDDGADEYMMMTRRFENVWDSASTELEAIYVDADSRPHSPENGLALFNFWVDTGIHVNNQLFNPHGIAATVTYANAEEEHSYESGKDFDSDNTSSGCTITASTDWAAKGVQSIQSYTPVYAGGTKNAYGTYISPNHDEIWIRAKIKVTQADDWGTLSSANDETYFISGFGTSGLFWGGWGINGAGVITWQVECRDGASYVTNEAGTPVIGTEYCIELHWKKDGAAGLCNLYVDGALMCTLVGRDTADYGNCETLYAGLISNNRDGATTSYIDIVAWGFNGDNRIGCEATGWFRTDSYPATASMNEWGSLDSTDDDDANVSWGVWTAAPVLIVDGLITAVDLEDAGVADTDDPIQIRADISNTQVYVVDVRIGEKQGFLDYIMDNEPASTAIKKSADILGMEYKLGWDNLVTMVDQLGEDKTDYIILLTAKSQSAYPDKKPNIVFVNKEPDFDSFANAVKILGAGEYPTRKKGTAKDQDSIDEFGVHWIPLTNKDCTSIGMCNTYARTEVNIRKDPLERIEVNFYDDYDSKDIEIGDIVWIVDEETELNQKARIMSLTYGWNASGRFASASLINRTKAKTFIEYLAEVTDLKRWI